MRTRTFPFDLLMNQPVPLNWLHGGLPSFPQVRGSGTPAGARLISQQPSGENSRAQLMEWDAAQVHWDAWQNLSRRTLEPNVFMEPGFALSEVQHVPVSRRPSFLLMWGDDGAGDAAALTGLFSLQIPKSGSGHIARIWCSPMMALGAPLIDRDEALTVLHQLQNYLAGQFPHIDAIIFPQMALQGKVVATILRHAEINNLDSAIFDRRVRAVVTNREDPQEFLRNFISAKKRKELRRQRRRLEELGVITYNSASTPDDIREAMERFLALEASGWKGGSRTALLSDPSTATFVRSMSRFFARQEACRIDALELDGQPVAMGIVLNANDTAFYWKTAYDERYARYSPGVLFSIEMTMRMIAAGTHELINSCAIPNHPMIDHIWRERIEMGDIMVATVNASARRFALARARETARRRIRAVAKSAYYTVMRKHAR